MNRLLMGMLARLHKPEGGDGGNNGGGGAGGGSSNPTPKEPETFSKDYVRELRHESAGYRVKAQEMEKKAAEAAEAAAKAAKEADDKVTAAQQAANDRIVRAELKAVAIKHGMVDLDGLKLADLSSVKLNDAGEVEGAEELMAKLKEAKPYLFTSATNTSNTNPAPKPKGDEPKDARKLSKEEYEAERRKLTGGR